MYIATFPVVGRAPYIVLWSAAVSGAVFMT